MKPVLLFFLSSLILSILVDCWFCVILADCTCLFFYLGVSIYLICLLFTKGTRWCRHGQPDVDRNPAEPGQCHHAQGPTEKHRSIDIGQALLV